MAEFTKKVLLPLLKGDIFTIKVLFLSKKCYLSAVTN